MENRLGKNRKSPPNENEYIQAYLKLNPSAKKEDGLDIAAVKTKDGENGHGLLPPKFNRGRDKDTHRITDYISDKELKKILNSK